MPKFVDHGTWLAARNKLLVQEKKSTQLQAELTKQRRQLPMVMLKKDYIFETNSGQNTLADLFQTSRQLIVYHFMFGPDWDQGCPSCSFWADSFRGLTPHLSARNTRFVVSSNAPLEKLNNYKKRMEWDFDWVSAGATSFSADFGVSFYEGDQSDLRQGYNYSGSYHNEELPGISVFFLCDDGRVAHSYSGYARGLETLNPIYQLLDLTPMGRDEENLSYPMAWVKRHDEYELT